MSPITQAARQRLEVYVRAHQLPEHYPSPTPGLLRLLIDELIQAVRAEWPSDSPF